MYVIRFTVRWQFLLVHLDDILAISKSTTRNIDHGQTILKFLRNAVATLKLKRRQVFAKTFDCLGYFIRLIYSEIEAQTTNAIQRLKNPTNTAKLKSFFGFTTYSKIVFPTLQALLRHCTPVCKEINQQVLDLSTKKNEVYEFAKNFVDMTTPLYAFQHHWRHDTQFRCLRSL